MTINHQHNATINKYKSKVIAEEVKNKVIVEEEILPATKHNFIYSHSRKLNVSNPSWSREGKNNKESGDQGKLRDSTGRLVYQNNRLRGLTTVSHKCVIVERKTWREQ